MHQGSKAGGIRPTNIAGQRCGDNAKSRKAHFGASFVTKPLENMSEGEEGDIDDMNDFFVSLFKDYSGCQVENGYEDV